MKKISILIISLTAAIYSQWNIQTAFNPAQSIYVIRFFNENTGYCAAPLYNGSYFNIHKTTNGGQNWVDQYSGYTGMRFMGLHIIHPDTVYISGNDGLILKTINGGTNWVTMYSETGMQFWGLFFTNSLTGFTCGSSGRIMKTTNGGANWVNQVSGTLTSLSSIHFINENTGFISGYAIALKTTNAGAAWVNMNAPFISGFENFRDIFFFNENSGLYVSDLGRIGKTTNSGANWTIVPSGTTEALFGVSFPDNLTGYVCGNAGTILKTTNGGDNWISQVSPLNEIHPDVSFANVNTGYISTWTGKVLKTTNGGVLFISKLGNEVPEYYSLGQNYPNPFNPVTTIRFSIPSLDVRYNIPVQIIIYDILGRVAVTLVNEKLSPGVYETRWNASDYPSGIYYYRLSIAGSDPGVVFNSTKKMMLVK